MLAPARVCACVWRTSYSAEFQLHSRVTADVRPETVTDAVQSRPVRVGSRNYVSGDESDLGPD